MSTKEFEQELQLEAAYNQRELLDIQEVDSTPNWSFMDEEDQRGFYTGYQGKTLRDLKNSIDAGFSF